MTQLLFVHALSPLHAGTGDSVGAIDLPIARDRASGIPLVPGSSLKGSLRAKAQGILSSTDVTHVFGPDRDNASDHAGALVVGDANLLFLPVRSLSGTFAYVSSPLLLSRFARDAMEAGIGHDWRVPEPSSAERCAVTSSARLAIDGKVVIEELDLKPDAKLASNATSFMQAVGRLLFPDGTDKSSFRDAFASRALVVHDDIMSFLYEHATDVVARIALDPDTKTVKDGALWYQERLPTETILVSLVAGMGNQRLKAAEVVPKLKPLLDTSVQLGGDATTGSGRCRMLLAGGAR